MRSTNSIASMARKSLGTLAPLARAALMTTLALASTAHGQALDAVDVQARGADTEITLRFTTPILYLRHNPLEQGRSVRIYLRYAGIGPQDSDLMPQTRRLAAYGPAPAASIRFPETDGALSITFDQSTRFSVRPRADGRSIIVVIPAGPGD